MLLLLPYGFTHMNYAGTAVNTKVVIGAIVQQVILKHTRKHIKVSIYI